MGVEAAYKIFGWDDVTVYIQNDCADRENVINSELQPIIMKAVGMKDEAEDDGSCDDSDEIEEVEEEIEEVEEAVAEEIEEAEEVEAVEVEENDDIELPLGEVFDDASDISVSEENVEKDTMLRTRATVSTTSEISDDDGVKTLLRRTLAKNTDVITIFEDASLGNMISLLNEMGPMFDFGKLKAGYIDNGTPESRIIVPTSPPTVVRVNRKISHDAIFKVLSEEL